VCGMRLMQAWAIALPAAMGLRYWRIRAASAGLFGGTRMRRSHPGVMRIILLPMFARPALAWVLVALLVAIPFAGHGAALAAPIQFGAQDEESTPNRRQLWLIPSPDPNLAARAVLFRPAGPGPFRLAVIAHASTQNPLRRAQMPQPDYAALANWLVGRGFAVLVPERPGHGATGGNYLEDQGGCVTADYDKAGRATADSILAAMDFLRRQNFIRRDETLVVGHSAGGWGALALAGENPPGLSGVIVFAAGRGGRADDFPNQVCAPHTLKAAAAEFGKSARVPVTWLVAANDSYFAPVFSKQLADAFRGAGGKVVFKALASYGSEGHWLPESEGGVKLAASELERALKLPRAAAAGKR